MPKPDYMDDQPDVDFSMRSILVDWLIDVAVEFDLQTETLFLAVNFVDRCLSVFPIDRATLQLLGTTCMFIAA